MRRFGAWWWLGLMLCACGGDDTESDPPAAQGSWPQYGRDQANTRANLDETAITASGVASLSERWRADMPGCTSTPAVLDGVVYVGDWAGTIHAYDVAGGGERWSLPLTAAPVDPSPLLYDGKLFIGDGLGDFHAVDLQTREVAWSVTLDDHPATHIYSSAAAADGIIFVGVAGIELVMQLPDYTFRGSLVALDAETGAELWRVYMTEDDATSGAGVSVWSSVAVDEARGLVFIGTGNTYEAPASPRSDSLLAIDYRDGSVKWARQFTADDVYTIFGMPPQGPDADVGAAPNLFTVDGRDLVGVGDKAGVYSVLDRDTGDTVWAVQLTPGAHLGGVMTSGAYADGVLYLNSNTFGDEIEGFELDDPVETDTNTTFALDAADGSELWSVEQPYPSVGGMLYAGGVVYHGSAEGTLHAMDARDGSELWTVAPGDSMASGASLVDGRLFVCHGFAFFTSGGAVQGGLAVYTP